MQVTTRKWMLWLAVVAGMLDFGTGLGLVFMPGFTLGQMGVAVPAGEALVFLQWVGAFVGAVGGSYLWAVWRGGEDRLRAVLEFTVLFRLAAGAFSAVAVARGWLSSSWVSVPVTDFALVVVQIWLLKREGRGRA